MRRSALSEAGTTVALLAIAALLLIACDSAPADDTASASETEQPIRDPGVIARVEVTDLTPGFEEINFYHDVPGLLLDSSDPVLSGMGSLAHEPGRSDGQGFANPATGELLFVVTIVLNSPDDATRAFDYIVAQPLETIFEFISPDEQLFESAQLPAPALGDHAARYSLRYGAEKAGQRIRDVATDLVVYTDGGSLLFLLQSVNTADEPGPGESADITAVGRALSAAISIMRQAQAAQAAESAQP